MDCNPTCERILGTFPVLARSQKFEATFPPVPVRWMAAWAGAGIVRLAHTAPHQCTSCKWSVRFCDAGWGECRISWVHFLLRNAMGCWAVDVPRVESIHGRRNDFRKSFVGHPELLGTIDTYGRCNSCNCRDWDGRNNHRFSSSRSTRGWNHPIRRDVVRCGTVFDGDAYLQNLASEKISRVDGSPHRRIE